MATPPAVTKTFAGRWRIIEVHVNGDDSRFICRTQPPSSTAC